MVVPPIGRELIESSPFTDRIRSCMLVSPSPALFIAASMSKPTMIADGEVNFSHATPQSHFETLYPAMLRGIAQGFL
jgi:hypothetical protein